MPLKLVSDASAAWEIRKICVVGPGIVGMPMAAMLAHARIREGTGDPAEVVVIQRDSPTSGWKVDAINSGKSPIGGVEPDLDRIVAESVELGLLRATHDYADAADADVVLVCVQTDKKGIEPDYGPMFEALGPLADALAKRPEGNIPLVVFESTLAPSSMASLISEHFAERGLVDGRDVLLGNSPNRVMPGRLVERVAASDKLVAGLNRATPELIRKLYSWIVTRGTLHPTNSLTAEIVKTLENAYRDVRIAFAAEIVRYCDRHDLDFFALRDAVNLRLAMTDRASMDPSAVPVGGILVPTVGVGGHCLPKDGVLLWWRKLEAGADPEASVILESRRINDRSPLETIRLAQRSFGDLEGREVAILGAAYRGDSEDTRNSPGIALAGLLLERGARVRLHDPHVRAGDQNIVSAGLQDRFSRDLHKSLYSAEILFACSPHQAYLDEMNAILTGAPRLKGVVDGCNLMRGVDTRGRQLAVTGIGRGTKLPEPVFVDFTAACFRALERGVANEVSGLVDFLNGEYAGDDFQRVAYEEVRALAATCSTGCALAEPGGPLAVEPYRGFIPRLVELSLNN